MLGAGAHGWCLEDVGDDPGEGLELLDLEDSTGVRSNRLLQFDLNKLLAQICCSWGCWGALEPGSALPAGLGDRAQPQHRHKARAQLRNQCQGHSSALQPLLQPGATRGQGQGQAWPHRGHKATGTGSSQHLSAWCCLSKVRGWRGAQGLLWGLCLQENPKSDWRSQQHYANPNLHNHHAN